MRLFSVQKNKSTHKIKLVVNMSRIGNSGAGLSYYSKCFLEQLCKIFNEITVVSSEVLVENKNINWVRCPKFISISPSVSMLRPILYYLYSWYLLIKYYDSLILSTTHHAVPFHSYQMITIHDLRPYYYPDSITQWIYFHLILPRSLKKIKKIITPSQFSKKIIKNTYGINPDKISVVSNMIKAPSRKNGLKNSEQKPFLLMVGAREKHKNAHELIEMSDLWKNRYNLIIISQKNSYQNDLIELATRKGILDKITFLNYIPDNTLEEYYQACTALVYPSLMEGFGIPPLQAMLYGKPSIVSDNELSHEIYGDSSIFVQLGNKTSWQKAFEDLENAHLILLKRELGWQKSMEYNENRMYQEIKNTFNLS